MSDEYQLRKDVDRLIDDVYGVNSKLVSFDEDSNLRGLSFKEDMSDAGTIDTILKQYNVISEDNSSKIQELEERIAVLESLLNEQETNLEGE